MFKRILSYESLVQFVTLHLPGEIRASHCAETGWMHSISLVRLFMAVNSRAEKWQRCFFCYILFIKLISLGYFSLKKAQLCTFKKHEQFFTDCMLKSQTIMRLVTVGLSLWKMKVLWVKYLYSKTHFTPVVQLLTDRACTNIENFQTSAKPVPVNSFKITLESSILLIT